TKVIGFFAYRSRQKVVCTDGHACLIAGSEEAMNAYLSEMFAQSADQFTTRKIRFGEILRGLGLGGAYAFDEIAYARFLLLARTSGLPVADADFESARAKDRRFFTVQVLPTLC